MRGSELLDKMELVNPSYVEKADMKLKKKRTVWLKWSAAAACLALAVFAANVFSQKNSSQISLGGIVREYRNVSVTKNELTIEWPWEYRTISEQYTTLNLNGTEFLSRRPVAPWYLGDILGRYDVTGVDTYSGQEHAMTAEVYQIAGVSTDRLVAVKLDEAFYVFGRSDYAPPENLGEVLDDYSLEQTLSLEQFTECDDYEEKGYFLLNDDTYVWEVLNTCRNAAFIKDDSWVETGRSLSFTASSEALGAYKNVFSITEDGHIWTNLFDYAYIFDIGREAASQIFSYVSENSVEAEPEPYAFSLAGTLTEITDEYIIVDDTVLCSDEKDGMGFKIYLDDMRIRRHIEFEKISVGEIVVVSFTGKIDVEAGNVVEGAYSLSRGYLSEDGVSVPE